ncbi:MAG: glutaredoxin family protein [Parcubacteria group bacterium]|nr:glutaredoxin family protein [Parcubacteria group bacterium]
MKITKVKIYTTPTCAFCHAEKEFLKEHNITFEEFDVASNASAREEMIQKTGQMGVPVSDIDGTIVVGFDKTKLGQLLGIS